MNKNRVLSMVMASTMVFVPASSSVVTLAAENAKWTEEQTADGWMKVTQDGGKTLGYSSNSGVTLLEDDGYVFKDLNRNGVLDPYEDWRLDADTRAKDLVSQMAVEEKLPLMLLKEYDFQYDKGKIDSVTKELDSGMRAVCTPFNLGKVEYFVKYVNGIQEYVEGTGYGIPVEIDAEAGADLSSAWPGHLALAATFDPQLAGTYARTMSEEYRALGIAGMMAPQTDLATEPRWSRITGTFGEDPKLASDMVKEYVNGLQSSYDEEGNDLGWGEDSILPQVKHFPGDGAAEGGRESHSFDGKYCVYPGDNFATHLLPFKSALELPGLTGAAVGVMPSYSIAIDADGEPFDDEAVASGFSEFKLTETLRESVGYDGVISSDFVITGEAGGNGMAPRSWGVEDLNVAEQKLKAIDAGVDRFGGESDVEGLKAAYDLGVEEYGEEYMQERIDGSAFRLLRNYFRAGLFENIYAETSNIEAVVNTEEKQATGYEALQKGIVMLKNSGNLIKAADTEEKPTVYIPMIYRPASAGMFGTTPASWSLPADADTAAEYFNVVTDTVAETLTGPADEDGNPTAAWEDIVRASDEEVAACDYALVIVSSPASSGYDSETEEYIPISLQYGEYTADGDNVREPSIAGDATEVTIESPYGAQTVTENEDRSYYGKTANVTNSGDLDTILMAAERCENVIVAVNASKPMIFSEFEDKVDAIVMNFNVGSIGLATSAPTCAMFDIITGKAESSGLLPLQMPADMDTVEAQYEDVPRDMECYVDSEGNTYDFTFGMNWSGVINDERVAAYNVEPLVG